MSTSRSTVGVAVLDGKLYAVGGRDGCSCLSSAEVYDPHTNKWTMISSMRHRRGGNSDYCGMIIQNWRRGVVGQLILKKGQF
jgi:N-acetylneuraminic acid mutarotase